MSVPITVLLVDEDTEVLELTKTFIEREDDDMSVVTETSAGDALDRLEAEPETFDCVVSDYSMPSMNGIEFLQAVRERDSGMPFFIFTGRDSRDIETEATNVPEEVTGYIQKGTGTDRYADLAREIREAVES